MTAQLPQPAFWILTVLAAGRRHGYEIMREASEASEGRVELKVTTLYAALERLEREGLIVTDGEEVVNGRARRYYRITDAGSGRLAQEVEVLERSVRAARERLTHVRIATLMPTSAVAG
ncbi:MAG: helix-turn-helix transcriptional regulator [Micrococcales bacterium]|nr:helix-turn-helix transcriptional regulator [Micrococcales bacterium]